MKSSFYISLNLTFLPLTIYQIFIISNTKRKGYTIIERVENEIEGNWGKEICFGQNFREGEN